MNICILSSRYPFRNNMVHVFVKKLVDEWAKCGHHCIVISPVSRLRILFHKEINLPYYERQEVGNGIYVDVYRPRYMHYPYLKYRGVPLTKCSRRKSIERTIRKTGLFFDFIYGHFFSIATEGWKYAIEHNIPLFVATGESVVTIPEKPCVDFSIEKYRKDLCGVIAVSTKNMEEASTLGIIAKSKTKVFPNGANLELFKKISKKECRERLNLPLDVFIVICVGQFIERKGQRRVLHAIEKLGKNDIKTIFIGKGNDDFEHPSILYKGPAKNTDLPFFLNAADLFVLPTLKEGCCNAIIEALACGLPIISSDLPFNHDVLNKDNSILVDPNNVDEIARGIEKIYSDPLLAEKIANKSFIQGQSLSITTRSKGILEFIQEKISER